MRLFLALLLLLSSSLASKAYAYDDVASVENGVGGVSGTFANTYTGDKALSPGRRGGFSLGSGQLASDPRFYFGARYYDPRTSVWVSADPLLTLGVDAVLDQPSLLSAFAYVSQKPLMLTDPTGLQEDDRCDFMCQDDKAVAEATSAHRGGVEEGMDKIRPVAEAFVQVNPLIAASEAVSGKSAIEGRELSTGERVLTVAGTVLGTFSGFFATRWLYRAAKAKFAAKATQKVVNRANHLFGPKSLAKHNLKGVLDAFGGDNVKAFQAIETATQKLADRGAIEGIFSTTVKVGGETVTVSGRVIDNIANVGTAFIP